MENIRTCVIWMRNIRIFVAAPIFYIPFFQFSKLGSRTMDKLIWLRLLSELRSLTGKTNTGCLFADKKYTDKPHLWHIFS